MTFEEAALTCHQLGGSMPLPKSFEDIEEIIPFEKVNETLVQTEFCQTHWLPIMQGNKNKGIDEYQWEHYKLNRRIRNIVPFLPWQLGQPNGLEFQQCVIMAPKTRSYYDVDCMESHCFFCSLCKHLHFTLRGLLKGLTKGDDIDSQYIYIPKSQQTKEIQLEGYYDHKINLNREDGRWEIIKVDNGTVGTLTTKHHYPFGKHIWNVNTSRISRNAASHTKEMLKLSHVSNALHYNVIITGLMV